MHDKLYDLWLRRRGAFPLPIGTKGSNDLLYPPMTLYKILDLDPYSEDLRVFLQWLVTEKVLVSKGETGLTCVCYVAGQGSVRGYRISKKRLKEIIRESDEGLLELADP